MHKKPFRKLKPELPANQAQVIQLLVFKTLSIRKMFLFLEKAQKASDSREQPR